MSEEDKKESGEISRRQFIAGAGMVVGGAAVGAAIAYPIASGKEVEVQVDVPKYVAPDGTTFSTLAALTAYIEDLYGDGDGPGAMVEGLVTLNINGDVMMTKIEPSWTLAYVLREKLGLTGTKRGCDVGNCGVCTVIMDGRAVLSCLVLCVEAAEGQTIETIEGLSKDGLTSLQQAMVENDATQCGFCTPGQVMTATALLRLNSSPNVDEIKEFMAGTLCRCGTQPNVIASILQAGS
jgi:xanthine dehydrogenase YagT iron-sulfur-binding subunit